MRDARYDNPMNETAVIRVARRKLLSDGLGGLAVTDWGRSWRRSNGNGAESLSGIEGVDLERPARSPRSRERCAGPSSHRGRSTAGLSAAVSTAKCFLF